MSGSVYKDISQKIWRNYDPYYGLAHKTVKPDIQGWGSQHRYLADTVVTHRPSIIVEVGVWKGASCLELARAVQSSGLDSVVIAIDTWLGSSEHWINEEWNRDLGFQFGYPTMSRTFLANMILGGVKDIVLPLPLDSTNAAVILQHYGISPQVIHIDGAHDFESVMGDLNRWWNLLTPGGVMIMDDYDEEGRGWPDVRRAVKGFLHQVRHTDFEAANNKCRFVKPNQVLTVPDETTVNLAGGTIETSEKAPARLFTVFGTVLYVDADSGRLRHGPPDSSPANAVFVAEPGWGQSHRKGKLMQGKAERLTPITCLSDHCQTVASAESGGHSAAGALLELIPLERGLIAFAADGHFLTAEPGGQIYLRNQVCSTWECFLASEDWCSFGADDEHLSETPNSKFDTKKIQAHLVHPLIRKSAVAKSTAPKVLIFGYTKWSHGRVYYDLCKQLYRRGYIVDIVNWRESHSAYFAELISFYDLFVTALDGVGPLTDIYNVPYDKVVALSHHELDIRMLIEQKGVEIFDKFANYGVVSEYVYCASLMRGVSRIPKVVPLGVNFAEFYSKISERLTTVGYAGSMSVKTYGIEWKRGQLAEAAAREAGLDFRVAGSTEKQISFLDMPEFYRSVDAVLVSSISESAGLPFVEAAAAGRLVIGTPVGHFPRKAYEGGGILAPVEAAEFKAFTAETLRYYKNNPAAYQDKCHAIQEAAKQFDWKYTIDAWIDLIEGKRAGDAPVQTQRALELGNPPSLPRRLVGSQSAGGSGGVHAPERDRSQRTKFSIITPTLQRESLVECCKSVDRQTHKDWEHLICIDGMEFNVDLMASILTGQRVVMFWRERFGNYGNTPRNRAWTGVTGDYVLYLDDDNLLASPNTLESIAAALESSGLPSVAIFPILRHGSRFFHDPPALYMTDTANLVLRRDIAQWPDGPEYTMDGIFIERLRDAHGYMAFPNVQPIVIMPTSREGK